MSPSKLVLVIGPSPKWFVIEAQRRFPSSAINHHSLTVSDQDTVYQYIADPQWMRGLTGAEVQFWGHPPYGTMNRDWIDAVRSITRP